MGRLTSIAGGKLHVAEVNHRRSYTVVFEFVSDVVEHAGCLSAASRGSVDQADAYRSFCHYRAPLVTGRISLAVGPRRVAADTISGFRAATTLLASASAS